MQNCVASVTNMNCNKGRLSYHLCVECFSQLSFDSEVYTKSAAVADFVYVIQEVPAFRDFWYQKGITKFGDHEF